MNFYRVRMATGAAAALAAVGAAVALEHWGGYHPCELCIAQRIAMIVLAAGCIIAVVLPLGRPWRRTGLACALLPGLVGAGIAIRQLIMQAFPPQGGGSCGLGLDKMMGVSTAPGFWHDLFYGSGECAHIQTWLGITLPAWSLAAFVVILTWVVWTYARSPERS